MSNLAEQQLGYRLLSTVQVEEAIGLKPQLLRRLFETNVLRGVKVGRRWFVRSDVLDEWTRGGGQAYPADWRRDGGKKGKADA